jgi:hypothetical protein
MAKKKVLQMDAGKSLRLFQEETGTPNKRLGAVLDLSDNTIATARKKKTMSGNSLIKFSDYFGVSCSDFIAKGEG